MKIAIWYIGGTSKNMGDRAILTTMLQNFSKKHEVFLLCKNQTEMQEYYKVKTLPYSFVNIRQTIKSLKQIDVLVWGGGSIIQDQSSILYILHQSALPYIAYLLKKKIFCFAVGIGPLKTSLGKFLAKFILNKCHKIVVREKFALATLKDIKVNKPDIKITEDPAVLLPKLHTKQNDNIVIGINCREWFHYSHSILPIFLKKKLQKNKINTQQIKLEKKLENICLATIKKYKEVKFVFVPMYYGGYQEDEKVVKRLIDKIKEKYPKIKTSIISKPEPIEEIKRQISQCSLFIGVRLHSLILSSTEGVPIIALNYLPKGKEYLARLGLEKFSHDVANFDENKIIKNIDYLIQNNKVVRQTIKTNIEPLRKNSKQSFVELDNFIKR